MVTYTDWNRAVHDVYQNLGGEYDGQAVAPAVTRAAARFWRENREQIQQLALDAARTLAEELIREELNSRGAFPPDL